MARLGDPMRHLPADYMWQPPKPPGPLGRAVERVRAMWRSWPVRATRWVARRAWRHRRRLAPVYTGVGVYATGAMLWLAPDGSRTAATLALGSTAALVLLARRRARRWGPRRTIYAAAAFTYAWAWITAASVVGVTPPMPGLLMLATVAFGVPWWWWHRTRPVPPIHAAVARWEATLGREGGRLAGSTITPPRPVTYTPPGSRTPVEIGWTCEGQVNPAQHTTETAIQATPQVASAFGVPLPSVAIEPLPTGEYDRFKLTIYQRNPLADLHVWPGPTTLDANTGIAPIGIYGDMEPLLYRFWLPGSGPWHSLISGTTGAGKSTLLNILLAIERHHPDLFVSLVIDPQYGASLPDWQDNVSHYARTEAEGLDLLLAVRREMYRRNRILSQAEWTDEHGRRRRGVGYFDLNHPVVQAAGLRILSLTIDEAHAVLALPVAAAAAEDIAKMGRKCGIKLRLVTQLPLIDQLGGSSTLKDMVSSGNVIVLRTGSRLAGDTAFQGTLPVDPVLLPRQWPDGSTTAGLCFSAGAQFRPVQARIFAPGDVYHWATTGHTVRIDLPPEPTDDTATNTAAKPQREPASAPRTAADSGNGDGPAGYGEARRRILDYLAQVGEDGARTGVIAHALGLPMSTVSSALRRAEEDRQVVKRGHEWVVMTSRV